MTEPYPYQKRFWSRWETTANPRLLISAGTGAGKTIMAAHEFPAYPLVIICAPGDALEPWLRDWPELKTLTQGPRKTQSKRVKAEIEAALAAHVVLTTPGILAKWMPQLAARERRFLLVLDEAHQFDAVNTHQSRALKQWAIAYPHMDMLALTATFVRKEARDVWSLANIFAPREFPGPAFHEGNARYIGKQFLEKYCNQDPDLHFFFGAKLDALPELKERLRCFVEFVEPEEVLLNAPKAQFSLVYGHRADLVESLKTSPAQSKLLLLEHREVAESFAKQLGWALMTGEDAPLERVKELGELRARYTAGETIKLVATWKCVKQSVSLAWFERTLLCEPPTTPGLLEQLTGRFERPEPAQRVPAIIQVEASERAMKRLGVVRERAAQAEAIHGISDKVRGFIAKVRDRQLDPTVLAIVADYDADFDAALNWLEGGDDDSDD